MPLSFQVLGDAGRDNALFVKVDTGQNITRLLFDCGAECLDAVPFGEVEQIDHLLFSHLHMDHVAGFDTFFRCTYGRDSVPNRVWGPAGTSAILQHRFQGFLWNLVADQQASWLVHDVYADRVETRRYELSEAFREAHPAETWPQDGTILHGSGFTVDALLMNHGTPSVAYVVRESPRVNIDPAGLSRLGLPPGPWLQRVRGRLADPGEEVAVAGKLLEVRRLQEVLRTTTDAESIAYLTDFWPSEADLARLEASLRGVTTVVCECQYRQADGELARKNFHMTTGLAATIARRAGVGRLVLFHLSDRYRPEEWPALLAEARAIFPSSDFPEHWRTSAVAAS